MIVTKTQVIPNSSYCDAWMDFDARRGQVEVIDGRPMKLVKFDTRGNPDSTGLNDLWVATWTFRVTDEAMLH